jgi:hypothetical protein
MLHGPLSLGVVGVQLADQLLRTPLLAEPLQDAAARSGGVLSTAARSLAGLLEAPQAGHRYGYGLADSIGLGLLWSALVAVLVVRPVGLVCGRVGLAAGLRGPLGMPVVCV